MITMLIQTVHGVSSPIVRGGHEEITPSSEEPPAKQPCRTTQLYRDETAKRLEVNNRKASGPDHFLGNEPSREQTR